MIIKIVLIAAVVVFIIGIPVLQWLKNKKEKMSKCKTEGCEKPVINEVVGYCNECYQNLPVKKRIKLGEKSRERGKPLGGGWHYK